MIIGFNSYGQSAFKSPSPPVRNIKKIDLQKAIFDELYIGEDTNMTIDTLIEEWQMDTYLWAKFAGDLEAGNINNNGIKIEKFAIKRRKINEIDNITLDYEKFYNGQQIYHTDYTQQSSEYIYTIVPVGENGLEGQENAIQVSSEFTGWFLVDRENNEVMSFDKFFKEPNVDIKLNQGRVLVEGLKKYPTIYYTDIGYNTFTLETVVLRKEWERLGEYYDRLLNQFVLKNKPFLAKSGDGSIFVVDVHDPQRSSPLNTWKQREYITVTVNCTEIMNYQDYMKMAKLEGIS